MPEFKSTCRFDAAGPVSAHQLTASGYLMAPAYLTRPGVFEYRQPDGRILRELRPPDEVFHPDSLASLAMLPLTDEHPITGRLDSSSTRALTIGHLGENIVRDGDKVAGKILVTDSEAIKRVLSGQQNQLSVGYSADVYEESGVFNGQPYDHVQRNIRGNHIALTSRARLGPEMRVKLDSADAVMIDQQSTVNAPAQSLQSKEQPKMRKFLIDGVEVEVSETAVQLIEKQTAGFKAQIAGQAEQLSASKSELAKQTARADSAVEAQTKAEAALKSAQDPATFSARIKERVELEKRAAEVLGDAVKLDSLDDVAVKAKVIEKLSPTFKAEGKSAEYIAARFDADMEHAAKTGLSKIREATRIDGTGGSNQSPRERMIAEQDARASKSLTVAK